MTTINQPSAAPTRKLSASLVGLVIGALVFETVAAFWPDLRAVEITGFGDLSIVSQIIVSGAMGYVVKDRPNA